MTALLCNGMPLRSLCVEPGVVASTVDVIGDRPAGYPMNDGIIVTTWCCDLHELMTIAKVMAQ